LAVGALLGGAVGLPGSIFHHPEWNLLGHELAPVLGAEIEVPPDLDWLFMGISTALGLAGIGLAWAFYGGGYREPARKFAATFPRLVRVVQDKFYVDEAYDRAFVRPLRAFANFLYRVVDRWLIDGFLVGGVGFVIDRAGRIARSFQAGGDGQRYMAV